MTIFVKQGFFAFVAKLFLAKFGFRRVFVSLSWVSQGFCQLILDLARFLEAYFRSRRVFGSLFWV